jgi:hypothetical protein
LHTCVFRTTKPEANIETPSLQRQAPGHELFNQCLLDITLE